MTWRVDNWGLNGGLVNADGLNRPRPSNYEKAIEDWTPESGTPFPDAYYTYRSAPVGVDPVPLRDLAAAVEGVWDVEYRESIYRGETVWTFAITYSKRIRVGMMERALDAIFGKVNDG